MTFEVNLEKRTVYGVIEALDSIFSPGSTKFSDYVKETSDDNGFLRTCFCKKQTLLEDRPTPYYCTHIVVGSSSEIKERDLICVWTDAPFEYEDTLTKLQVCFISAEGVEDEVEWNKEMGYTFCYIVEIASKKEGV